MKYPDIIWRICILVSINRSSKEATCWSLTRVFIAGQWFDNWLHDWRVKCITEAIRRLHTYWFNWYVCACTNVGLVASLATTNKVCLEGMKKMLTYYVIKTRRSYLQRLDWFCRIELHALGDPVIFCQSAFHVCWNRQLLAKPEKGIAVVIGWNVAR